MSHVDPALAERLLAYEAERHNEPRTPDDIAQFIRAHNEICEDRKRLSARVLELEGVIRDCAPVMITVSAFNADEADGSDLKAIATWYGKAERSYSAFDVWLNAARAHNAESKAKADARKEPG